MKKLFQNIALLLVSVGFSLILVEIASRAIYTRPWYQRLVEEQVDPDWTANIHRNAFGLRGHDLPTAKGPNTKRILLLGDSFTFGSGVPNDADIFAALLEQKLNAQLAERGTSVEVLNGGIPGSQTSDWVDLLQNVGDSFQPDVIIVVFFLRDGTLTSSVASFFGPIRDEIVAQNQSSLLYQNVYLYRLYSDSRDRTLISDSYTQAMNDSYFGDRQQTQEWRIAQTNMRHIKMVGEEMHARVGLIVFPVLADFNGPYPFQRIVDEVARFGSESQLPTLNLLPAFKGKNAADLWVSSLNQHPNSIGHEIAANGMLAFVQELVAGH
jgi:hypothetical protein